MADQHTPGQHDEHGRFTADTIEDAATQAAAEVLDGQPDNPDDIPLIDESMLPEVVIELAATSERHTAQLDTLDAQVSALGEAFQAVEESLTDQVDLAHPSRWAWEFLTQEEASQLWRETRWFVDYLIRRYPLASEVSIPPCWYRHTVAVDELSDGYAAWRETYCSGDRPSTAMTAWRDRWLWPMLHRLATHADWRECKERREHVEPTARQDGTDDQFDQFVDADLASRPAQRPKDLPWRTTPS